MLLPWLPIYLHGNGPGQLDLHLPGLSHPVWLAQPNLHLRDVEAGEDAEHLQLLVGEAGGEVEVFMA